MKNRPFAGQQVNDTTIEALRAYHDKICRLFEQYLRLGEHAAERETELTDRICEAFDTLRAFEEQVLYPEIRETNEIIARSLARSDRNISMHIAFIRATADAKRERAVIELIELFHSRVWTCEQFVFPFGQWRVPATRRADQAEASRAA